MAGGFGVGLARAISAGVAGYGEGELDNRKQMIALKARQDALARQDREDQYRREQDEIKNRIAGYTPAHDEVVTDPAPAPAFTREMASVLAQRPQSSTFGDALNAGLSPEAPPAGSTPPAKSIFDTASLAPDPAPPSGPQQRTVRREATFVDPQIARAEKQRATQVAERTARLQGINAALPDGHPNKMPTSALGAIAGDDAIYNKYIERAAGLGTPVRDPIADHQANRLFDAAHPLKDPTGPKPDRWQVVPTEDGPIQVDPQTGITRTIRNPDGTPMRRPLDGSTKGKVDELRQSLGLLDEAVTGLRTHPEAIGPTRGWLDAVDARVDPEGVPIRAAIANVTSLLVHARSGGAVTPSEFSRLVAMVPNITRDTPESAIQKLMKIRETMAGSITRLTAPTSNEPPPPPPDGSSAPATPPRRGTAAAAALKKKFKLE